jgi:uncharacterized protein
MNKLKALQPVPLKNVRVSDAFWSDYIELIRNTVIPYQWEALNDRIPDAEPSHAVKNFRIAAGLEEGEFKGFVFQDSDIAKWLEAVGYTLEVHPDPQLEALADGIIEVIEKAQQPDGYLDTYFILKEPGKRWTNLGECHELYCAGHMMEAAVAYYKATGKKKLLDVMCRFADYIDSVFGTEPGKIQGYDGHQEVELALVKLYHATGNERYLKLGRYFIQERGREPNFFITEWKETRKELSHWTKAKCPEPDLKYFLAHKPVYEQEVAIGHAVRAVYMYSGMADIARETGDEELFKACKRLWNNIVTRQMYITGGIGSTHHGEAFSFDYDLPNDTVYAESCASIGLIFFAHRMLQMDPDGTYADIMERTLYNTVLGSMSRDGKHFFYVNPLDVWPEASEKNPGRQHVKPVRQKWFGCACCPPNIARLLASLGQYVYSSDEDTVYTHLYIGGTADMEISGGKLRLIQENNYPWEGNVKIKIETPVEKSFKLALRIPGWCRKWTVFINGTETAQEGRLVNGYLTLDRCWKTGDEVELCMELSIELLQANPKVRADAGRVAIQRGPLVYCLEEEDNGSNLSALSIASNPDFKCAYDKDLMDGAVTIHTTGIRTVDDCWGDELYRPALKQEESVELKAVPYFMWGNRTQGEMLVWIRQH